MQRARDPLIDPHEGYLRLRREPAERQALYRELFRMHIEPESLKAVRQATQMNRVFGAEISKSRLKLLLQYA